MRPLHLSLLMFLSLAGGMACSDDNNAIDNISISKDQQNQTVYANETEKTIRFTATEAWQTQVDYTTAKSMAASADNWVTLDPPRGEAGEVIIKVTLGLNTTGSDRRAEVKITCGKATVSVAIEQKGKTAEGEVPVQLKKVSTVEIREITNNEEGNTERKDLYTFKYDEQGRLVQQSLLEDNGMETVLQLSYEVAREIRITEQEESEQWIVTLNEQGYATRLEVKESYGGYNDQVYTFGYDVDGHLVKESWKDHFSEVEYIEYSWENGNFVASVHYFGSNNEKEDENQEVDNGYHRSLSGQNRQLYGDTIVSGYTFLSSSENNKLNIDPNLFIFSLGNNNYNANSNAYYPCKGRLDLLAMWGFAGERNRQYVNGPSAYEGLASAQRPDQEYYYSCEWICHPIRYEFDEGGYLLSVTDKADKKIYKVISATGEKFFIKETFDQISYHFTYNN